jgi:hypothetical protein
MDPARINQRDPREWERRQLLDTYKTFGYESGVPTFRYSLIDGVTEITTELLSNYFPRKVMQFHYLVAFAMICSAVFVQTKGLAPSFHRARKAFIAPTKWATLSKLLRRIAWLVSMPNQISTMFIQEAPVGVK